MGFWHVYLGIEGGSDYLTSIPTVPTTAQAHAGGLINANVHNLLEVRRTLQQIARFINARTPQTAIGDADVVATADAGATYTSAEQDLINDNKAKLNTLVGLFNDLLDALGQNGWKITDDE